MAAFGSSWLRGWLGGDDPEAGISPPELTHPGGEGPLIWMRIGAGYDEPAPTGEGQPTTPLVQLLAQLRRGGFRVALSRADGIVADIGTRGVSSIPDCGHGEDEAVAHLAALAPATVLLIGDDLPGGLIRAAYDRNVPVVLAEARFRRTRRRWHLPDFGVRAVTSRLTRVLVTDQASVEAAISLGCPPDRVEVTGPIALTRDPLKHLEPERIALAEALRGRQLWLAACITEAEEAAVTEAHLAALGYSHRAMLIALPSDPARCGVMAARLTDAGLVVAQRALDEDPTDEVNVYVGDDPVELGLWYRLAPVTFMGGTLDGPADASRHPFEPAALGSAVIHGPQIEPYIAEWRQLDGAGAARVVNDAASLAQAVSDLLAPDSAAQLAANAWSVSTGGAGVAARVVAVVRAAIRGAAPNAEAATP